MEYAHGTFNPQYSCTYALICGYVAPFWNPDISISSKENHMQTLFESIPPMESEITVSTFIFSWYNKNKKT